jgi:Tfp pilus assembly protein PilF
MRVWSVLLSLALLAGCASVANSRGNGSSANSSSKAAEELALGTKLLHEEKYDGAEKHLRLAVSLDAFSGLAHNNLGSVFFAQGKLYEAASEFQEAIKLLPGRPEPHNNLGLVLEAGNKLDEAIAQFRQAVDLQPDNPELLGNLARAHVRRGDRDPQTRQLLIDLMQKETRPEWREWVNRELALHYP